MLVVTLTTPLLPRLKATPRKLKETRRLPTTTTQRTSRRTMITVKTPYAKRRMFISKEHNWWKLTTKKMEYR